MSSQASSPDPLVERADPELSRPADAARLPLRPPRARFSLASFDYLLPPASIAQTPVEPRDASRLLHLSPTGSLEDRAFAELPQLLRHGDLLVANDTRVRAARLRGSTAQGAAAEVLLLHRLDGDRFVALVRPGRRLHAGACVRVAPGIVVRVLGSAAGHPGAREVMVETADEVDSAIAGSGEVPLPPYITTPLGDASRYQTVYAAGPPASAAAPTAGLHFTERVSAQLRARGVGWATVQLEVGLGTFAPVTALDVRDHRMHEERCTLSVHTAAAIEETQRRGGRVIAVGTTVVRTLESRVDGQGRLSPGTDPTHLFITPGHRFAVVDGLLTNFHQPRSSLLVLLSAFIGERQWRGAYQHALEAGYRFLSFGDCMLCWRQRDAR